MRFIDPDLALEKGRAGDPLPTGDMDLEPGGVRVEAYRLAADGWERRKGRLISDWERDMLSSVPCLLGSLMEAAAMGGELMDSGPDSLSCMKATTVVSGGSKRFGSKEVGEEGPCVNRQTRVPG